MSGHPFLATRRGVCAGNADAARAAVLRLVDEAFEALEVREAAPSSMTPVRSRPSPKAGDLAHPVGGPQALPLVDVGDEPAGTELVPIFTAPILTVDWSRLERDPRNYGDWFAVSPFVDSAMPST